MKKDIASLFMTIVLCIFLCFPVFAESDSDSDIDYHSDSVTSKIITAYKTSTTNNIPHLAVSVRLLDPSQDEFQNNGNELDIPDTYRGQYFAAFSWVLSGNAFETVNVRFTFGPMTLEKEQTSAVTKVIPYSVKLVYGASRIGNSPIHVNSVSSADSYVQNTYLPTTLRFYYADSIGPSSKIGSTTNSAPEIDVSSNPTAEIVYNMSTNTIVKNSNGSETYTEGRKTKSYKTDYYIPNASAETQTSGGQTIQVQSVCDYWNRMGTAYVRLKITSSGRLESDQSVKLDQGKYYATVQVVVEVP